jgi:hypothetical protein
LTTGGCSNGRDDSYSRLYDVSFVDPYFNAHDNVSTGLDDADASKE